MQASRPPPRTNVARARISNAHASSLSLSISVCVTYAPLARAGAQEERIKSNSLFFFKKKKKESLGDDHHTSIIMNDEGRDAKEQLLYWNTSNGCPPVEKPG